MKIRALQTLKLFSGIIFIIAIPNIIGIIFMPVTNPNIYPEILFLLHWFFGFLLLCGSVATIIGIAWWIKWLFTGNNLFE